LQLVPVNAEPSMNRTFRGISIHLSDEDENADDSIRVNREFGSNDSMKVIHMMRNMMIQEFQYLNKL
jgi:hypothetical protein